MDDATGKLALAAWEPTQARQPRFFALSPDGGLLYAANQGSDIILTFRGDRQRGALTPSGQIVETGSPVSTMFAVRDQELEIRTRWTLTPDPDLRSLM